MNNGAKGIRIAWIGAAILAAASLFGCRTALQSPEQEPLAAATEAPTPAPTPILLDGGAYTGEETSLQLVAIEADFALIETFPNLETLDLSGSTCFERIAAYRDAHPTVEVRYTVPIGGSLLTADTEQATVASVPDPTLLRYLPRLTELTVTEPMTPADAKALLLAMPQGELHYAVSFAGMTVQNDTTELDLTAYPPEQAEALAEGLAALPELNDVSLNPKDGATDWTLKDVGILQAVRESLRVDYRVTAFRKTFSLTDAVVDLNNTPLNHQIEELRALLPYLRNVQRLDMENCQIPDEQMAALREEFPTPKIVWRVKVRPYSCRTDALMIRFSNYISHRKLNDDDLKALVYCNEMKYMDLGHSNITHPYVVAYMPNLEVCIVSPAKVTDISGIENCKKLEYCELFNGKIADISPLAACTELKHLNLCMNQITDLSPLYGLTKLERLWISRNPIPEDQIAVMQSIVPDCVINTTAKDPTQNEWRWKRHGDSNYAIRYELLRKQMLYDHSQNTYSVEPDFD